MDYTIKEVGRSDIKDAMQLVWDVFSEFEAPEYSKEGIVEFKRYIAGDSIKKMQTDGTLKIWGCYQQDKIIGVLAIRPPAHISLLFVDKAYHRRGIARSLFNELLDYCRSNRIDTGITVHSSPYAQKIYHRLGFVDTGSEQVVNGLRFIPMKRK